MKNRFTIILIAFLLLFSTNLQASHYHGADISYTSLGNNQYDVQFTYFIDCGSAQAGTAVSLTFEPSSSSCSSFTHQLNLLPNYPEYITHLCPTGVSNCTNPSAPYGYRKYIYKGIVTMPTTCTDWNIIWYTCCRNASAGSLVNGSNEHVYIKTTLNTAITNSSPTFNEGKPLYSGCPNDTTYLSFLADDLDGDSLVYSLVAPLSGSIGGTISNVAYASGFSGTSPIIGTTSINSKTGLVRFIPTTWIRTYVAVLVEEYRNNIKIGETRRDLSILIGGFACINNTLPKVSKGNGTNVSSGSFTFTHKANTPFSLNLQTYDVEASTGLDSLASLWGNVPTNATTIAGTSPSLNWTPTNADTGSYFITLYLTDNHCDFAGVNTFIFKVIVKKIAKEHI